MILNKKCSSCREYKIIDNFGVRLRSKDGKCSYCKDCAKTRCKNYYNKNKDKFIKSSALWRKNNREKELTMARKHRLQSKYVVFNYYSNGSMKCLKCGFDDVRALNIDHINDDGNTHRAEIGRGGVKFLSWLKKNNFPKGFQVLCANCNQIKEMERRGNFERKTSL